MTTVVIPTEDELAEDDWRDLGNMNSHNYYVYIMGSPSGTLYVGVTNNLEIRVWQHKNKIFEGFTKKYGCTELLYFEETSDINAAIAREKTD